MGISQTITVNDTDFSKGKLGHLQDISISDVAKFHGHSCDGLVEGFMALEYGLKVLYPDGIIDRTNTRVVSKSSPCLTDIAVYITGGRLQYNTFSVDDNIEGIYIVERLDTRQTIAVSRKPNVKPAIIVEMGNKAIAKTLSPCELKTLNTLENAYAKFLKNSQSKDLFEVKEIEDFNWQPKHKTYIKTDIINKNQSKCNSSN